MKESESVGAERAFIGTTFALAENCAFEYNILTISLNVLICNIVSTKKSPKGDFNVRIKVLLHICKPNVYQRFATVFYALFPRRLPSFCMVLRPPARFACAVAVSPCMTVQI